MSLNITRPSQKLYLFNGAGKRLTNQISTSTHNTFMICGWWLMIWERKTLGTNKRHCLHTWTGLPSTANPPKASAGSSRKQSSSTTRWSFWEQSNPISCLGGHRCVRRHTGTSTTSYVEPEWRQIFCMCSGSLTVSRTQSLQHTKNLSGYFICQTEASSAFFLSLSPAPNASHPIPYPISHFHSQATLCTLITTQTCHKLPPLRPLFCVLQYSQALPRTRSSPSGLD